MINVCDERSETGLNGKPPVSATCEVDFAMRRRHFFRSLRILPGSLAKLRQAELSAPNCMLAAELGYQPRADGVRGGHTTGAVEERHFLSGFEVAGFFISGGEDVGDQVF